MTWKMFLIVLVGVLLLISLGYSVSKDIGFTMFIMEESNQVCTFSSFASSTARDYPTLAAVTEFCRPLQKAGMDFTLKYGWMAPIAYPAYLMYFKAQNRYWWAKEREFEAYCAIRPENC